MLQHQGRAVDVVTTILITGPLTGAVAIVGGIASVGGIPFVGEVRKHPSRSALGTVTAIR